jgi:hypothetical protein
MYNKSKTAGKRVPRTEKVEAITVEDVKGRDGVDNAPTDYVVDEGGTIFELNHDISGSRTGDEGEVSIGVTGNAHSPVQVKAVAQVAKDLVARFDLEPKAVMALNSRNGEFKEDPKDFPWIKLRALLEGGDEAEVSGPKTYEVKAGDTLWDISQATGASVEELKTWNGLTSDTIYTGQELIISDPSGGAAPPPPPPAPTNPGEPASGTSPAPEPDPAPPEGEEGEEGTDEGTDGTDEGVEGEGEGEEGTSEDILENTLPTPEGGTRNR